MSVEGHIICTISEAHLKNDKYVIQIDAVVKKKADDKLKQRKKDGYIGETHKFMGGGKSPVFNACDESVIRFEIEEGLRPMTKFKDVGTSLLHSNLVTFIRNPRRDISFPIFIRKEIETRKLEQKSNKKYLV